MEEIVALPVNTHPEPKRRSVGAVTRGVIPLLWFLAVL
jgi:hypothetical protein